MMGEELNTSKNINILSLETACSTTSVVLSINGVFVDEEISLEGLQHAKNIAPFTQKLLDRCGVKPKDLDAICVGDGPGSYTGLRIVSSFAKGLAYALNIPLLSVSSLKTMASLVDVKGDNVLIIPAFDARREDVYAQVFKRERQIRMLTEITEVRALNVKDSFFVEFLNGADTIYLCGDGARKLYDSFSSSLDRTDSKKEANLILRDDIDLSAKGSVEYALDKYRKKEFEDIAYYTPNYLKEYVVLTSKKKLF